jgi:hypothetical protein
LAKGIYFYQINNSKGELLKFGKFLKEWWGVNIVNLKVKTMSFVHYANS